MKVMHGQVMDWLEVLDGLLSNKEAKHAELDIYWLQAQRSMALEKMMKCDEEAQLGVVGRIVALEETVRVLNAEL
ncbi:MAG: hypothetical protein QM737_23645 [Ferruginibacter sp.]